MTESEQLSLAKLDNITSHFDRIEKSLDRITKANGEILDRLTRMEVQQSGHGAEIHHQREQIKEVSARVSRVELDIAVHKENTTMTNQGLIKRWGAIGAISLVILAALGNALGSAVLSYYQETRSPYEESTNYDRYRGDSQLDDRLRESSGEP